MATVRDPAFWKRFSTAVHLNDEASISPSSSMRPELKDQDSWLDRQKKKRHRKRCMMCMFSLMFTLVITIVTLVFVWLSAHGWFQHGEKVTFP